MLRIASNNHVSIKVLRNIGLALCQEKKAAAIMVKARKSCY